MCSLTASRTALYAAIALVLTAGAARAEQRTFRYEYDLDGRLVRASDGASEIAYGLDPAGNLVARSVPEPGGAFAGLAALGALLAGAARGRRRPRSSSWRRAALGIAGLLVIGPGAASAQYVYLLSANGQQGPILAGAGPIALRASDAPDGDGIFASETLRVIYPPPSSCTGTITLAQTVGPGGFVNFTPPPPATPVPSYDFTVRLIQKPTAPVNVTLLLTWVGSGGPVQGCPTATETFTLPFELLPPAQSGGNLPAAGVAVDPVNSHTGELFTDYPPDLLLDGPMPLGFSRFYAAHLDREGNILGALGANWLHNFDWVLRDRGVSIEVVTNRGRVIPFHEVFGSSVLVGSQDIPFQLRSAGLERVLADPRSDRLYRFDSAGRLVRIEDGRGNAHTLTYTAGQLTSVADGLGRTLTFSYTGSLLTSVSDGTRTLLFAHTGALLSSFTDARGKVTTYDYTNTATVDGLLTEEQRPVSNVPLIQSYDAQARVASQSNAALDTQTLAYAGLFTTVTDPFGNDELHEYAEPGRIVEWTDAAGEVTTWVYNSNGQRTAMTDRLGTQTLFSYHAASAKLASITTPDGTITYSYAPRLFNGLTFYDLSQIGYPDGTNESFVRDANGNMTSRTDRGGELWTFTYDARGQMTGMTNPAAGHTTLVYNANRTLASRTDPSGNVTSFGYDGLFRVKTVTHPDTSTHSFVYDAGDHVVSFTDANGDTSSISYDDNGNMTVTTDAAAQPTTTSFDAQDRVAAMVDPLGHDLSFRYDKEGHLVSATDRRGNVTSYGYDAVGRRTSITDAASRTWNFGYDAEGVLASWTNPLGRTWNFGSDAIGRITRATSPSGFVTERSFDPLGRPVSSTDPLGRQSEWDYDARSLLVSALLPSGSGATYTRNALGEVTEIEDPNGSQWLRSYDTQGRVASRSDPLGNTWSYSYDDRSRVGMVDLPAGTLLLEYDGQGHLTRRLYSDGTDLVYGHDAVGRLTSASSLVLAHDADSSIVASNGLAMTRDPGGRVATLTLAPGKVLTYSYDQRNLLIQISDWAGGTTTFGYDNARQRTSITRPNGVTTTYGYDVDGRLRTIQEGALASTTLNRDAAGRIRSAVRNAPLLPLFSGVPDATQSYDAASQVATHTHDVLGRVTDDGTRSYVWDLAGRLVSYQQGASTTAALYDGLGYRIARVRGGTTRSYVWNYGLGIPVVNVERQNGSDLRYYVTTPEGALLYSIEAAGNTRRDYHYDEMGNTHFLTGSAGQVIASYAYDPYGRPLGATGGLDNPFTWQGQLGVVDDGNGLYSMRSRIFDSALGRFLSRDPIDSIEPLRIAPYVYALANPQENIDPLGLTPAMGPSPLVTGTAPAELPEVPFLPGFLPADMGGLMRAFSAFRWREYMELVNIVDNHVTSIVQHTPAQYLDDVVRAFNPTDLTKAFDPRALWWSAAQSNLDELERAAQSASKLRPFATAFVGFGVVLDGGLTIYDGVCHGDSAGIVALDTGATVAGDLAVLAAPPLLIADVVTLGGVSGSITNAVVGVEATCEVLFSDRFTPADAEAIKRRMTRKVALKGVWWLGEQLESATGLSTAFAAGLTRIGIW
jgi:RHS repeat-associated protein